VCLTKIWLGAAREAHYPTGRLTSFCHSSQDLIHYKMQGALNGKTMHVVSASFVIFTEIVYTVL